MPIPGEKSHRYKITTVVQESSVQTPEFEAFVIFDEEQPGKVFIETAINTRLELDFHAFTQAIIEFINVIKRKCKEEDDLSTE